MTERKLTNEEWKIFFNTLFECVGNEKNLHAVCVPLVKAMDARHMEESRKFLEEWIVQS
jgi:hypothetical protein